MDSIPTLRISTDEYLLGRLKFAIRAFHKSNSNTYVRSCSFSSNTPTTSLNRPRQIQIASFARSLFSLHSSSHPPLLRTRCFAAIMDPIILPSSTRHAPTELCQIQDKTNGPTRPRTASFSSTRKLSISWGRRQHHGSWLHALGCTSIMTLCPLLVIFYWVSLSSHHGSLMAAWQEIWTVGPFRFFWRHAPRSDHRVHIVYTCYLLYQAGLYQFLPGKLSVGQLTPAGHLLKYRTNGLFAWVLTHMLFGLWVLHRGVDPAIIARHWEPLLVTLNAYGFALSGFSYAKAHLLPNHEGDRKLSGELCSSPNNRTHANSI